MAAGIGAAVFDPDGKITKRLELEDLSKTCAEEDTSPLLQESQGWKWRRSSLMEIGTVMTIAFGDDWYLNHAFGASLDSSVEKIAEAIRQLGIDKPNQKLNK